MGRSRHKQPTRVRRPHLDTVVRQMIRNSAIAPADCAVERGRHLLHGLREDETFYARVVFGWVASPWPIDTRALFQWLACPWPIVEDA